MQPPSNVGDSRNASKRLEERQKLEAASDLGAWLLQCEAILPSGLYQTKIPFFSPQKSQSADPQCLCLCILKKKKEEKKKRQKFSAHCSAFCLFCLFFLMRDERTLTQDLVLLHRHYKIMLWCPPCSSDPRSFPRTFPTLWPAQLTANTHCSAFPTCNLEPGISLSSPQRTNNHTLRQRTHPVSTGPLPMRLVSTRFRDHTRANSRYQSLVLCGPGRRWLSRGEVDGNRASLVTRHHQED